MKFYVALNKKNLTVILFSLIGVLLIGGWYCSLNKAYPDGSTNTLRVNYISGLGLIVDEETCAEKEIVIPQKFDSVYKNYNELQKKAGFDLLEFKGETATIYTFNVKDSELLVHLIVKDGKIIGGDIADVNFRGEMLPLKKPK